MRISVIGTGYVGLVSGVCFAEIGHDCICVDIDKSKVSRINAGQPPIHEVGLESMLKRHVGQRLRASDDLRAAVMDTDITFIAVGTPFDGEHIDLTFVREVSRQIGDALRDKSGYHVVVVKSTVVPGTTDNIVLPLLEDASGKLSGRDFGVGMNPEFLTEGVAIADFMRPDRIVIGGLDDRSVELQRQVYATFSSVPQLVTNNSTAEMIKYASNSVLATLISFSNEFANLCSALRNRIDVAEVMKGVHLSRYFTSTLEDGRSVTAPITSFLWAGCGYGGSCLPKDTKALSAHGAAHGKPMPLLDAVIETNAAQPSRLVAILAKHFPALAGVRVTILGLAFKEDTDDMRESPSIAIVRMLVERGASIVAYDPIAMPSARLCLPKQVMYAESLRDAVADAQAVLLLTRWKEFEHLPQVFATMDPPPILVDGRRMLSRAAFARYDGIGL